MNSLNVPEIIKSFSIRFSERSEDPENKEKRLKAIKYQLDLEANLPECFQTGVHFLANHPDGYEIWIWGGKLLTTKVNDRARCPHCNGRRLLQTFGAFHLFWFCLDCNKEIFPIDSVTGKSRAILLDPLLGEHEGVDFLFGQTPVLRQERVGNDSPELLDHLDTLDDISTNTHDHGLKNTLDQFRACMKDVDDPEVPAFGKVVQYHEGILPWKGG